MTVRDVASFVGYINFYAQYIPQAELHMLKLRELTKLDYESVIGDAWTPAHEEERMYMLNALIDDPCFAQYDYRKRCYLRTDWSTIGFGYVLL